VSVAIEAISQVLGGPASISTLPGPQSKPITGSPLPAAGSPVTFAIADVDDRSRRVRRDSPA